MHPGRRISYHPVLAAGQPVGSCCSETGPRPRSRERLGRTCSRPGRPSWRALPSRAATWPQGRESRMRTAGEPGPTTVPPRSSRAMPSKFRPSVVRRHVTAMEAPIVPMSRGRWTPYGSTPVDRPLRQKVAPSVCGLNRILPNEQPTQSFRIQVNSTNSSERRFDASNPID